MMFITRPRTLTSHQAIEREVDHSVPADVDAGELSGGSAVANRRSDRRNLGVGDDENRSGALRRWRSAGFH